MSQSPPESDNIFLIHRSDWLSARNSSMRMANGIVSLDIFVEKLNDDEISDKQAEV